jgi:hypothetical protein
VGAIILLVCSVLTLVGVFLPWITISGSISAMGITAEIAESISGWDLVSAVSFYDMVSWTGTIDPYLIVGGAIAMVVGTLGAIIVSRTSEDPEGALKIFGGAAIIGAIVAVIGAVWFMIDSSDIYGESSYTVEGYYSYINIGRGYGLFISLIAAIGGIIATVAPMIMESRGATLTDSSYLSAHGSTDFGALSPREIAEMKAKGPAGLDPLAGGGYPGQQPAMGTPNAMGPLEPTGPMGAMGPTGATGPADPMGLTGPTEAVGPMGPTTAMGAMGAMGAGARPTGTATEHFNRASDLEAMGEHDKAMVEYSKAIAADEGHAMSYFNRGSLHMQMGKTAEASSDFAKVIEISDNPDLQRMAQLRMEELGR